MRRKIEGPADYLIARAQMETDIARGVLSRARDSGDYKREKAAAKLCAFNEHEERVIEQYVEAKLYYPDLARMIEDRRPHLRSLYEEAELLWQSL